MAGGDRGGVGQRGSDWLARATFPATGLLAKNLSDRYFELRDFEFTALCNDLTLDSLVFTLGLVLELFISLYQMES